MLTIANDPAGIRVWLKAEPGNGWMPGPAQLKHFAECVDICQSLGLYLVPLFSADDHRDLLWSEPRAAGRYIDGIVALAKTYKGRKVIAAIDLMNEPAPSAAPFYAAWCIKAVAAVRKVDADRVCIVEVCPDARPETPTFPVVIPGVVYSVHSYWPYEFTHAGLPSAGGNRYPYDRTVRSVLLETLLPTLQWARANNVPIYLGEFSAINTMPDHAKYIALFEAFG